jgi:hypothetical protein
LIGFGLGSILLALVRGDFGRLAFPSLFVAAGLLLLTHSGQRLRRFPSTDLERGLDRLFALLLPTRKATTTATLRIAIAQHTRLAGFRHGARRWGNELQLITTDGYETASRISARNAPTLEQDDEALVAETVRVLRAERASAGAELPLTDDAVSMLAYGLGARPAEADLTSLDDLLRDLGLSGESDEFRTHFDDIVAAQNTSTNPHVRNDAERRMFRELAGASFVLGASTRILELASLAPAGETPIPAASASSAEPRLKPVRVSERRRP